MTRFDPRLYPGSPFFEARAQELRAAELARLQHALADWLGGRLRALGGFVHWGQLHAQLHAHRHAHRPHAH